ncbi:hypothetical protein B0H14DRAFT_2589586 [Mycena olivaceomarginata]|nr:hypothetical protein B0H14DRAFT_2589586 [Mycena olivaceomarginata]
MGDFVPEFNMNLASTIILWILALVPGTTWRYIWLALACTSLAVFASAQRQDPAKRISMLEDALETAEETLNRAKLISGARAQAELAEVGCRLLQVKLSASKIRSRILEMRSATWQTYIRRIRVILRTIDHCAGEVKGVQTSMLLIIEEARRRTLSEELNEAQETLSATTRSPTRCASCHLGSNSNVFEECYKYVRSQFIKASRIEWPNSV